MITTDQINTLKDYVKAARTVLVIVGSKPTEDQLSAATSLYLACNRLGKEAGLYAPKEIKQNGLAGLDEQRQELGKQNLVVEFDYNEEAVDKVSYHISQETNKFYLTIKPKKGAKPLEKSSVEFNYAGADADLIFLVGVHELEDLEQLYFGYEPLFDNAIVVTLHSFQPELGNLQLDLSGTSSFSESLAYLLEELEVELNADMASNLLRGIENVTNNLQSRTANADTFETVAKLLRAGARRQRSSAVIEEDLPRSVEFEPKKKNTKNSSNDSNNSKAKRSKKSRK